MPSPLSARSDHFDGRRFFNPEDRWQPGLRDMVRLLWDLRAEAWPAPAANPHRPRIAGDGQVTAGGAVVTFVNHATVLVQLPGLNILTDPVWAARASPVQWAGPRRRRPPGMALAELPRIDLVVVSHNHYDHMDLGSLRVLARRRAVPILTGLGNDTALQRAGVPGARALDWWQGVTLSPHLRVTFVPAQHWSSRRGFDRRRTLWGGFVIEAGPRRLYFAGDSGYCPWFRTIRERIGPPDLALLPIGAYEPRWFMQPQHMNPAEAVQAHRDLGARRSVGMHFGTVQLTDEAIDEPLEALARAKAAAGLADPAFTTLDFGETRRFG